MREVFTMVEVYAPNDEMIVPFNSKDGQWTDIPTDAKFQFMCATNNIYAEVFDAVRAEIDTASQSTASQKQAVDTNIAAFDVKV